jgi:hypothetical protein
MYLQNELYLIFKNMVEKPRDEAGKRSDSHCYG